MHTRLNAIALSLGYTAERGGTAGDGAAGRLLVAIASRERTLVKEQQSKDQSPRDTKRGDRKKEHIR